MAVIPCANVLGVAVHAVDMPTALEVIETAVTQRRRGYICATGVHGVMEAQRSPALASFFANALMVVPDGMPTVWMGHMQGLHAMKRVFGPDLMLAVAGRSQVSAWSHFLCGGDPGVAEHLRDALTARFPSLNIVGTYTPPFRSLNEMERSTFVRMINQLRPDIIWVGLSTPKQERFMAEYLPLLNTVLMIGVGAAFDYHTGRIRDSPSWMKQCGLQWFHRLLQEPLRLWKRYLLNNPSFLLYAGLQATHLKHYALRSSGADTASGSPVTFSNTPLL